MTRHLQLGDVVPYEPPQALTGPPIEPQWCILVAMPRQEAALRDWLLERGVDAWYPEVQRAYKSRHAPGGTVLRPAPVVTGYVMARFEAEPRWHVILDCRHVARYVSQDERPVVVSDETIAQMSEVPAVLVAIKMREEAALAAERDKHRPVEGQPARIETGILKGKVGIPLRVAGQYVRFEFEGWPFDVHVSAVRRVEG